MRHYLERLRQRGELLVTDRPVSARHELAAITEKVQRTSNRPILFTNVSGTELPVLTNTYGSRERLARYPRHRPPGLLPQVERAREPRRARWPTQA